MSTTASASLASRVASVWSQLAPGIGRVHSYGTAGFRAAADTLPSVFVKVGMLAALRSRQTGMVTGVMITASHNPIADNGVKIVDPDGGMLAAAWEKYANLLAAATTQEAVVAVLEQVEAENGLAAHSAAQSNLYVAMDTRPSSPALCKAVVAGAEAMGASVRDFGLLTTPQLHFIVRMTNAGPAFSTYASEEGYARMMAEAFGDILAGEPACVDTRGPLVLDCANGVGGPAALALSRSMSPFVALELRNMGLTAEELSKLNDGVGAEHAQKARLPPAGFDASADIGKRCASVDGDADRLVYHYFAADGEWKLLDGDKIACLIADFLGTQLAALGLPITDAPTHAHGMPAPDSIASAMDAPVSVGAVQTAYANGASTQYIRDKLRLPIPLAKTGVKFVHHKAQDYDIGVYFEANGHGTVLFHPAFLMRLMLLDEAKLSSEQAMARNRLLAASRLVNQAVGDALSDAFFIEAILILKKWTVQQWDAMYTDLPSRQLKLTVADRTAIKTNEDETRVLEPVVLQDAVDALCREVPGSRSFVRPSGTEDAVRIYAEAPTQVQADLLAHRVLEATHRLGGGVGALPPVPSA